MATNPKDVPQHYYTLEEYFALEDASDARFEYWDGDVVCMSGGSRAHGMISSNVHGSAPDIAGQGIANPTALLQSGILMLRHLGEREAADRVEKAMLKVYTDGQVRTRDVGGTSHTDEFAHAVIQAMG